MLKKKFPRDKFPDVQNKPFVKFTLDAEELSKVTVEFFRDTNPHQFGMILAMISKGLTENHIVDSVIAHGESIGESELTVNILDEMESCKEEIDSIIEETFHKDNPDDIPQEMINIYPISPSWGNPEITELFDSSQKEILPRNIRWQYLVNKDDEELFEENVEETTESNAPGMYSIPGMPGFISENQFQRLVQSQEPSQSLPEYEMRIGFTNFNITLPVYKAIANTNGVEYVKIYSRYSVIVAVGKMFDFEDIRREIDEKLGIQR